uniref:Retrovirus-related Pol polyprotein from transposon TNT 1-94 n=1 Tax=Cajanus cajan TaxID=3821 RepID=A0A151TZJ0_CAJCA|nr:Retrovirus-related Pol polyprotein from transposon TNT 1-94 [Cajanus cajan]
MKESERVKEYSDRLLSIVNKVRLLGTEFSDTRIVQKILVTLPKRFESTISSLENSKDLSNITLAELMYALQAQEQRRLMREEGVIEGALQAKLKLSHGYKGKKKKAQGNNFEQGESSNKGGKGDDEKPNHPPCQHCGKRNHPHFRCWRRPNIRYNKCNQLGHIAKFCNNKRKSQTEAQVADQQEEEEQLFAATCFATNNNCESWLIDSGCTHHMTYDEELFKELDRTIVSKVRIGNADRIAVKGKGTIAIENCLGTKIITDVLFVPEINQNLLSVGQLLEKGYKILFEDKMCLIKDASGHDLFKVKMKGKIFSLDLMKERDKREGSPVEIDISFESNSLVAKAIVAPPTPPPPLSSVSVPDLNVTPILDSDFDYGERSKRVSNGDYSGLQPVRVSSVIMDLNRSPFKGNDSSISGKKEVSV